MALLIISNCCGLIPPSFSASSAIVNISSSVIPECFCILNTLFMTFFHRQNKLFTGFKIMQKALSNGAETMAKLSGISFAILFGEISPKISIRIVITIVDTVTPELPSNFVNKTVAKDAVAILTILLPIKIVDITESYFSESSKASFAFLFPLLAILFSLILFNDEYAVSVAEK